MNKIRKTKKKRLSINPKVYRWAIYIIAVLLILIGSLRYCDGLLPYRPKWDAFYTNIHAELIGSGLSVFFINGISQLAEYETEKHRLILQMGSPDNGFAREALRQLDEMDLLQKGILYGKDLSGANLSGAFLQSIEFRNTNLRYANLSKMNLHLCDFSNSHMEGVNLEKAYLRGTKFCHATLIQGNLDNVELSDAILKGANLWQASLKEAYLVGADFEDAGLHVADLLGANMERCNFYNASLWKANLDKANLSYAFLGNADLTEATCVDTNWNGAKYNKETKWPNEDFDPDTNGCILVL